MYLNNIRLSTLGSVVTAVLIATLVVCAWGFWSIVENIDHSVEWEKKQLIAQRKVQLASDIYRSMGYVGFIHHFKNLVLRRDMKYYDLAQASAQASRKAISAYTNLADDNEKIHLATIRETLDTYSNKMPQIPDLILSGATIEVLDQHVRVNDGPALAAIGALIETAHKAEQMAAQGITASFQYTSRVIQRMVTLMSLMIGLSILLSLYGIRQVVGGMSTITEVFRKVSTGEQVESIPNQEKSNELGELANAADAFRLALRDSQANEAYLTATQNAAVDGLIIINTSGIVRFFNDAAEKIFGYQRNEVMGRNIKMLMPEVLANNHDGYLRQYLDTGVKKVIGIGRTVEAQRKNGECFPLELSVAEAKTESDHVFIGLVRDITERVEMRRQLETHNSELSRLNIELKENMEALAEAQEKVIQAEKMASLGRVVAGTAHALNTPLGIAVTSSSFVRDELLQIVEQAETDSLKKNKLMERLLHCDEALNLVDSSLGRASGLVKTLKALSLNERQDPLVELVFPDCLNGIMAALTPELESAGIHLSIESDDQPKIESHLATLTDVIHSLVVNVIYHAFEDQQDRELLLHVRKAASNGIEIAIKDNGIGIPEKLLPSIFEPFSTLKQSLGHHGLGLYAVHNLVTGRLNGVIEVASAYPGGGTCFTLSIPDLKASSPIDQNRAD